MIVIVIMMAIMIIKEMQATIKSSLKSHLSSFSKTTQETAYASALFKQSRCQLNLGMGIRIPVEMESQADF